MLGNAETPSRSALLHEIDKVSFAVNDLTLYLDTHPDCQEGLARFQKEAARRKELMNQYAKAYGPLTAAASAIWAAQTAGVFRTDPRPGKEE